MSNFKKVEEFHLTFGHPVHKKVRHHIFQTDPSAVQLRMALILEEVEELKQAVLEKNMVEVIDGLADILYVVYGMGHTFGIDLDAAFDIVHRSNMSKICDTEDEALESIRIYNTDKDFENKVSYRLADNHKHFVVYNNVTGKILKSHRFQLPNFTPLME